jgi:hypothetical protein
MRVAEKFDWKGLIVAYFLDSLKKLVKNWTPTPL